MMGSPEFLKGESAPFIGAAKELAHGAYSGLHLMNPLTTPSNPFPEPEGTGEKAGAYATEVALATLMAARGCWVVLESRGLAARLGNHRHYQILFNVSPGAAKVGRFLLRRVPYVGNKQMNL